MSEILDYRYVYTRADRFLLWFAAIVLALLSFRAPNVKETALDYTLPVYITVVQVISLPLAFGLMAISLLIMQLNKKTTIAGGGKGLVSFAIFQVILLITEFFIDNDFLGLLQNMAFAMILVYYIYRLSTYFSSYESGLKVLIRWIFYGLFGFILINLVIYAVPLGNTVWKGRFFGVTFHPNFIGLCGALCATLASGLLFSEQGIKKRLLHLIAAASGIAIFLASGSRTAMLAYVISMIALCFFSIRNSFLKILIILVGVTMLVLFFAYVDFEALNVAERGNTREETWKDLFNKAASLPIMGFGRGGSTSNSYLYAIVASGIIGAFFFYKSIWSIIRMIALNSIFSKEMILFRIIGVALLVAALFEGYLLDSASVPLFMFMFLAGNSSSLTEFHDSLIAPQSDLREGLTGVVNN